MKVAEVVVDLNYKEMAVVAHALKEHKFKNKRGWPSAQASALEKLEAAFKRALRGDEGC